MKTLYSYIALTVLVLTSSFTIDSQQKLNEQSVSGSAFSNLRVHRQGKAGATLTWGTTTSDIAYFVVERSYDGEFFEPAEAVSFTGANTYKYQDKNIYPGTIYYRVQAVKTDGSTEYSTVESVRIVQRG